MAGQVNGYGPKTEILYPMVLGLIVYLALTVAVVFRHPLAAMFRVTDRVHDTKYAVLRAMLTWFKAEIVWTCALMEVVLINAAMHYNYSLALVIPAAGDRDHTDIPVLRGKAGQTRVDQSIIF